MFKILLLVLCSSFVLVAGNRDFSAEYTLARELILKECSKDCRLSDLHQAVLLGEHKRILELVVSGAKIDEPAKHNWTAAHFAALHQERDIQELLYKLGASKKSLDVNRGTPGNLWKLTHLTDDHKVNFWDEKTASVIQISSQEFEQIMGARFVESTKMSPLTLANQWLKGFSRHPYSTSRKFPVNHDGVYIKKMAGSVGYGIFALRPFKRGEVIGEYQGEWTGFLNRDDADYSTQNINGAHLRGYVAFAAHGFPNAQLEPSAPQRGLSANELLVATTSIKPHEPVMWNYGTHEVVWGLYLEQLSENLDTYARHNGLGLQNTRVNSDPEHHTNIVAYILTTPTVFMRLVFERKISDQDLKMIFDQDLHSKIAQNSEQQDSYRKVGIQLKTALKYFATMDVNSRDNIYQFLARKASAGNTQILSTFLGNAEHLCSDSVEQSWWVRLKGGKHQVCSPERIERFWNKMWFLFCGAEGNKNILKDRPYWGDCQAIGQALKDKTVADLEDL